MEASYLGIELGHVNAAMIMDKFQPFKSEDLIFDQIDSIMRKNSIFHSLISNRPDIIEKDLFSYLFNDYIQILSNFGKDFSYNTIKTLSGPSNRDVP